MKSLSSINVLPAAKPGIRCWILDDARPGHLHQSLALLRSLQLDCCPDRIKLPEAVKRTRELDLDSGLGLLIGCGRRAAWYSKQIKQLQPALWTNIQILNPRTLHNGFDWTLVPGHDDVTGHQVISFLGALTEIDEKFLENARSQHPGFRQSPGPRVVMLVGGPTRRAAWQKRDLKLWLKQLNEYLHLQGGTAIVLNSRRTPGWGNSLLNKSTTDRLHFYSHDGAKNPYAAMLAFADYFWVTGDSVNMLAEACSTSNPVRVLGGNKLRGRIRVCWQQLLQRQRLVNHWENPGTGPFEPLRESRRVASVLRRRGALLGIE